MGEIQPTEKELALARLRDLAAETRSKILTTIDLLEQEMKLAPADQNNTVLEVLNECLSGLCDRLETIRGLIVKASDIFEREERDGKLTPAGAALLRQLVRPLFSKDNG